MTAIVTYHPVTSRLDYLTIWDLLGLIRAGLIEIKSLAARVAVVAVLGIRIQ